MIEILNAFKGKVIYFYFKGAPNSHGGLVIKVDKENNILTLNIDHRMAYVDIDEISMVGESFQKLEEHVVPSAFI